MILKKSKEKHLTRGIAVHRNTVYLVAMQRSSIQLSVTFPRTQLVLLIVNISDYDEWWIE